MDLFSLLDGWDLSPSLYYIYITTFNVILESGLGGEGGVITS